MIKKILNFYIHVNINELRTTTRTWTLGYEPRMLPVTPIRDVRAVWENRIPVLWVEARYNNHYTNTAFEELKQVPAY